MSSAITITKNKGKKHIDKLYSQINVLKQYAFSKADEFYNLSVNNSGIHEVITIYFLSIVFSGFIIIYIIINLLKVNRDNKKQLYLIDQNILTATLSLDKKVLNISNALCRALGINKRDILNTNSKYIFTDETQYLKFENIIYSAKEYKGEVYININDEKVWFILEILPQLDNSFQLSYFNIFLTNISDKKRIEEVSITDTLTGLYNRNYFEIMLDKEVRRSKRDAKPLSMVMLDIDYFKQYNDTYGHQDGDTALKAVSHILSAQTNRSSDYAFRVGGEEFVILSYHKDFTHLEEFVSTLLKEVESLKIPHSKNNASEFVTVSAGAIQFAKEHLFNTDEMYKQVDRLLYEAKNSGRNNFKSKQIK